MTASSAQIFRCVSPPPPEDPLASTTDDEKKAFDELKGREPWKLVPEMPKVSSDDHWVHREDDGVDKKQPDWTTEQWLQHFEEFCSDLCLLRYLRAHDWCVNAAYEGLVDTLAWRRRFKPHMMPRNKISHESETGKTYVNGFDKYGRPIVYLRNHLQNTKDEYWQLRHLIFMLESTIALMPPGIDKMVLIFDFSQFSARNATSMHMSKYVAHLLSAHYPERVGVIFACDTPWYFNVFYKLISPFIPPVTKRKIRFVDTKTMHKIAEADEGGQWANLLHWVDEDVLESPFGGSSSFTYHHESYWPALMSTLDSFNTK